MKTVDKYIVFLSVFFVISGVVFFLYPQIDIATTQFFYDATTKTFLFNNTSLELFFYHSVKYYTALAFLITFGLFVFKKISKKVMLYIFLSLSIAPGLIVNSILKDHWGRPRPTQTILFGGDKEFQKPFVKSDNSNAYSFSSGHAAIAFSAVALALLARRKKLFITLSLMYGSAVSFARVAAGGHYLSDVVTSFFIVTLVSLLLYRYFFKEEI